MKSHYDVQNSREDIVFWNKPDPATYQKISFLLGHCVLTPDARIADMGCGWGEGTFELARMNPQVQVVGVDIDPRRIEGARERFGHLPNLTYCIGDIQKAHLLDGPFDAFLNSSSLHHVYSYNMYSTQAVRETLASQYEALKTGGLIVVRDFLAWPHNRNVTLSLPAASRERGIEKISAAELLTLYAREARALLPVRKRGFAMREVSDHRIGWRSFVLPAFWAAEFIWRMDYRRNFHNEAQENYSFWNRQEWTDCVESLGARLVLMKPFSNPWIVENRFKGKIGLTDERGQTLDFPPTNLALLLQKTGANDSLYLAERSPVPVTRPYLTRQTFLHSATGASVDLVARPGSVRDYLPFRRAGDDVWVWAKCGYPRPLINAGLRGSANLDAMDSSGHVIEPVAMANIGPDSDEKAALATRLGLGRPAIGAVTQGLVYYPNATFSTERVTSRFVENGTDVPPAPVSIAPSVSGYAASGDVRAYDAQVLLRAAHVGLLPEARLEMNIYALLRALKIAPAPWMDGTLALPPLSDFTSVPLAALLNAPPRQAFVTSEKPAGTLLYERALFEEHSATGVLARAEHEFAYPVGASTNIGVMIPIARDARGHVCIGVESVDLPAAQVGEGNSRMLIAPQIRLPFEVRHLTQAQTYLSRESGFDADSFARLGEGHYTSLGMSRERCYPFMVKTAGAAGALPLSYVRLDEAFAQMESLRDASLMLGVFRATHAFGLWKNQL